MSFRSGVLSYVHVCCTRGRSSFINSAHFWLFLCLFRGTARGMDSDSEDDDMPGLIASSVTDDEVNIYRLIFRFLPVKMYVAMSTLK